MGPPWGGDEYERGADAKGEERQQRHEEAWAVVPDEGVIAGGSHDGADSVVHAEDGNGYAVDGGGPPWGPRVGEDEETVAVGGEGDVDGSCEQSGDAPRGNAGLPCASRDTVRRPSRFSEAFPLDGDVGIWSNVPLGREVHPLFVQGTPVFAQSRD